MSGLDAVIVGSGPNGLAAAITLARAGRSVVVLEANDTIGGAARSVLLRRNAEAGEEGFVHDVGSAIHPLAKASPFFRSLDLEGHGLRWVNPPAAAAHPLDDGRAAIAWHDLNRTIAGLGEDGAAYARFFDYWVENFDGLLDLVMYPPLRVPRRPILAARFAGLAGVPAAMTARAVWKSDEGRALFAGHSAHSILPLMRPATTSFGILLGSASHAIGWPFPEGGAQSIVDAMASILTGLGGEIRVSTRISSLGDLPESSAVIFALGPHQVESIAGPAFPDRYRKSLRDFRYGPGAFKIDYELSEPVPWTNADVGDAGTVHVGGTLDEIVDAERQTAKGTHPARPFVLVAQPSRFDSTRAPAGKHTLWAYCHVPNGSTADRTDAIEAQLERFAPGFRDIVIARHKSNPAQLESQNASLVGGDVGGGSHGGTQLVFRPRLQQNPFDTAHDRFFIGSASTTPGGGVHGMGGFGAAQRAMATVLR